MQNVLKFLDEVTTVGSRPLRKHRSSIDVGFCERDTVWSSTPRLLLFRLFLSFFSLSLLYLFLIHSTFFSLSRAIALCFPLFAALMAANWRSSLAGPIPSHPMYEDNSQYVASRRPQPRNRDEGLVYAELHRGCMDLLFKMQALSTGGSVLDKPRT